jgi:hypothetical protein
LSATFRAVPEAARPVTDFVVFRKRRQAPDRQINRRDPMSKLSHAETPFVSIQHLIDFVLHVENANELALEDRDPGDLQHRISRNGGLRNAVKSACKVQAWLDEQNQEEDPAPDFLEPADDRELLRKLGLNVRRISECIKDADYLAKLADAVAPGRPRTAVPRVVLGLAANALQYLSDDIREGIAYPRDEDRQSATAPLQ